MEPLIPPLVPPVAAFPQVTISLERQQVAVQSNIPPGPQAWETIRQMCYEGMLAAHEQIVRAKSAGGPQRLIEVPPMDLRRAVGG